MPPPASEVTRKNERRLTTMMFSLPPYSWAPAGPAATCDGFFNLLVVAIWDALWIAWRIRM
jgi:hypothetical protein